MTGYGLWAGIRSRADPGRGFDTHLVEPVDLDCLATLIAEYTGASRDLVIGAFIPSSLPPSLERITLDRMTKRTLVSVIVGLLLVACATGVFDGPPSPPSFRVEMSHGEGPHGQIAGLLLDLDTGDPVPSALALLYCTCLPAPQEATTNDHGAYGFSDLPPGDYTVQILSGAWDVSKEVTIAAGDRAHVRAWLRVAREPILT